MGIAMTVQQYLSDHSVRYDTVMHRPTQTSSEIAQASHISGDRIAKGVVLNTAEGYMLALLPASHHVHMDHLKAYLNQPVDLATEEEITTLFADCETGAVPAVGRAYGLDVIVEETLTNQPEVYFEAGDHATLVHLTRSEFRKLLGDAPRGGFSKHD